MSSDIVSSDEDVIWRYSIVKFHDSLSSRSAIDLEKTKICHIFELFGVFNVTFAIYEESAIDLEPAIDVSPTYITSMLYYVLNVLNL